MVQSRSTTRDQAMNQKTFWTWAKAGFILAFVFFFTLRVVTAIIWFCFQIILLGNASANRSMQRHRNCRNPYCKNINCCGCIDTWA